MKYLIFIPLLLFLSCNIDGVPYKHFHFNVWESDNGMIRVSYYSDYATQGTLYGACSTAELYSGAAPIHRVFLDRTYSEYAFTRLCTPMYFKIETAEGERTLKI